MNVTIDLKNLAKLKSRGYRMENIIMIDDTPEKLARNYGNLVRVLEYRGQIDDDELKRLMHYLPTLKSVPNVRTVEKRGWRNRNVI